MATRTEVKVTCDLPGDQHDEEVATRQFSVDGENYEADLCSRHGDQFADMLEPYAAVARRVRQTSQSKPRTTAMRERSAAIRAWAKNAGLNVTEHGRLPASVVNAYDEAHGGKSKRSRRASSAHR